MLTVNVLGFGGKATQNLETQSVGQSISICYVQIIKFETVFASFNPFSETLPIRAFRVISCNLSASIRVVSIVHKTFLEYSYNKALRKYLKVETRSVLVIVNGANIFIYNNKLLERVANKMYS